MTTPPAFLASITSTLQYLDTKLPSGSFVFFIGLEDGLLIWETLANITHPILQVPYARLWEFISCYNINPCWGWLNPDPAWRNFTQNRAKQLNAVFPQVRPFPFPFPFSFSFPFPFPFLFLLLSDLLPRLYLVRSIETLRWPIWAIS